ncbi:MAG: M2 family metallopeptidase [Terriglobia bacterium]
MWHAASERFLTTAALVGALLLAVVSAGSVLPAEAAESAAAPTLSAARAFIEQAEERLLELEIKASRASWVYSNFITEDTERISADAQKDVIAAAMELAAGATRFDGLDLPADLARKLRLLKLALTLPAPRDPAKQAELTEIATSMEGRYGKGRYCPEGDGKEKECLDLTAMTRLLATSRDADQLLDLWRGWRTISPPMRTQYERFVGLANEGARELGYSDLGALWRSQYDMPPAEFAAEVDRLWAQVKPLYDALHAHVRARLAETYGAERVPVGKPIPAHLLGNMWSQSWINIYPLVAPKSDDPGFDLTKVLREKNVDALEMVRFGERFFLSLGFEPLPETFWRRSLFTKPADREVVCHASAWDIDAVNDLRIKMCIEITDEDFSTIHHELGHNFYQRAYNHLSPLYRGSANDGFHEAVGDTIALSITPAYLAQVGLLDHVPELGGDLGLLMKMALDKVAFLPFGLLVDQWRWKVFSGEVSPAAYNQAWWELRTQYQGIAPPVARSERDFDPGAKYHIPANVPYTRYFLATILQFQFHRALCREAGYRGPLHRCSIYNNRAAGKKLKEMLEMGKSRPWPEALEAITGQRQLDATAILDYFAPLKEWLDQQNPGRTTGW